MAFSTRKFYHRKLNIRNVQHKDCSYHQASLRFRGFGAAWSPPQADGGGCTRAVPSLVGWPIRKIHVPHEIKGSRYDYIVQEEKAQEFGGDSDQLEGIGTAIENCARSYVRQEETQKSAKESFSRKGSQDIEENGQEQTLVKSLQHSGPQSGGMQLRLSCCYTLRIDRTAREPRISKTSTATI